MVRGKLANPLGPRLVGYARVSTEDQSLALQVDALRAAGVLEDNLHIEKKSGSSIKNRPQLWYAIKDCREGDTFLVWRVDRLARSIMDSHTLIKELEARGTTFRSLTEHIDLSTPAGRLAWNVMTSFAEFERDSIAARTKAGLAAIKAARGKGWKWGPKVIMTEAKIVRAGKLLNRKNSKGKRVFTGPEVADRFKVSTASIYGFWKYNKRLGIFVRKKPSDRGPTRAKRKTR